LIRFKAFALWFIWQVDVVCGDHLLKQYQSLRDICNTMGQNALQVSFWYSIPFSYFCFLCYFCLWVHTINCG